MKVLLNDGLEKEGLKLLQDAGIETDIQKRDTVKLIADIDGFDALIVRSATKVTKEIIEAGAKGKLKIIGRAGVGYDNIDVVCRLRKRNSCKICPLRKHQRSGRVNHRLNA